MVFELCPGCNNDWKEHPPTNPDWQLFDELFCDTCDLLYYKELPDDAYLGCIEKAWPTISVFWYTNGTCSYVETRDNKFVFCPKLPFSIDESGLRRLINLI
jgi:hypothetical protein